MLVCQRTWLVLCVVNGVLKLCPVVATTGGEAWYQCGLLQNAQHSGMHIWCVYGVDCVSCNFCHHVICYQHCVKLPVPLLSEFSSSIVWIGRTL